MLRFYLRKEADRKRTYGVLLEDISTAVLVIIFIGFILGVAAFVVGGVFGPAPYFANTKEHNNTDAFWHGEAGLEHEISGLSGLNQDVYFTMTFLNIAANETGFSKNNVKLNIQLYGRNGNNDTYELLSASSDPTAYEIRALTCPQSTYMMADCDAMIILRRSFIDYAQYKTVVRLMDSFDLHLYNLVGDHIHTDAVTTNSDYSSMSIWWHYTFLIASAIVFVAYVTILSKKQQWSCWHTEQKWVMVLFLFLIIYDNPIYAFLFFAPSWLFPFINIVFMASFICFLLLALLIITHSVLKKPSERTIMWFYMPKMLVVLPIWGVVIAATTYINISEKTDSHYVGLETVPYSTAIQIVGIALVVLYVFTLVYYVARALGRISSLPLQYSSRFKVVWSFTALVILGSVVNTVLIIYLAYNNAALFLSYHALYNLYAYVLALLFLPSSKIDKIAEEDEQQQMNVEVEDITL